VLRPLSPLGRLQAKGLVVRLEGDPVERQVPLQLGRHHGQVIATSEAYESKASTIKGVESVKRNAPNAELDDQTDQ
jgi:uncharacterized protein YegP (UPF0339 family)